jgi:signal transduction histidine kinase
VRTTFTLRTLEEARSVADVAAVVCADRWRVAQALTELLVNAVEHGSLGIGNARKTALLGEGGWEAEIARRQSQPEFAHRRVRLTRERSGGVWLFSIEDEGEGFDWRPFMTPDPTRSAAPNGRGIVLARQLAFSDLTYLGAGNRLRCSAPAAR